MPEKQILPEVGKVVWVCLLVASIVGCGPVNDPNDYLKVEEVRTHLALDLPSYSTFAKIKEVINLRDDQFTVVEDSQSPQDNSGRPPFVIFTVKIKNFEMIGYKGDLHLSFFNNRLESTKFYPQEFEGFVNNLNLDRSMLVSRQGVLKKPFTGIWIYTDFQNKSYIEWADIRLRQQKMDWIRRYA